MIVFHSDLDNTLIYSYKRDIGKDKKCVEIYQGREVSFMTEKSYDLLKKVKEKTLFVPVTTRTEEQYRRIDMGIGIPDYALVCNGGVLLKKGQEDTEWYQESVELVKDCLAELAKAQQCMEADTARNFEVRNIRGLFLFTKSSRPEESVLRLKRVLDLSRMEIFQNGAKVYAVPGKLSKGTALLRFRRKVRADYVIAAGDSTFDVPMLREANLAVAPQELADIFLSGENTVSADRREVFSDWLLNYLYTALQLNRREQALGELIPAAAGKTPEG